MNTMSDLFEINKILKNNSIDYKFSDEFTKLQKLIKINLIQTYIEPLKEANMLKIDQNYQYSLNKFIFNKIHKPSNITDIALKYRNKYLFCGLKKNNKHVVKNNEILNNFLDASFFTLSNNKNPSLHLGSKEIKHFRSLSINHKIKFLEQTLQVSLKNKNIFIELPKILKKTRGIDFQYKYHLKMLNDKNNRYTNEMLLATLILKNSNGNHVPLLENFFFIGKDLKLNAPQPNRMKDLFKFIYMNQELNLNHELDFYLMENLMQELAKTPENTKKCFLFEMVGEELFDTIMNIKKNNFQENFEAMFFTKFKEKVKTKKTIPLPNIALTNSITQLKNNMRTEYNNNNDIKAPLLTQMSLLENFSYYEEFDTANSKEIITEILSRPQKELEQYYYTVFNQFRKFKDIIADTNEIENEVRTFNTNRLNTIKDFQTSKNIHLKQFFYEMYGTKDVSEELIHLFYNTQTEKEFIEHINHNTDLQKELISLNINKQKQKNNPTFS